MPTYTNLCILQGWFEVDRVQSMAVNHMQAVVIYGWIYTTDRDGLEDCFDERHPIMLIGRPAEAVLEITRKINDKSSRLSGINLLHLSDHTGDNSMLLTNQQRPYVIAQGKLLMHDGHSCVDIKHISFLGLPWGALDALHEMEPVIHPDVRALAANLTPQEKSRMSAAIGAAIQAVISLRPTIQKG